MVIWSLVPLEQEVEIPVSEQGLGEELDLYGKSKRGFLEREQFLDRVAGANESARREARLKG